MMDEEKQLALAYQDCFATDTGKKVLADLSKTFNFNLSVVPLGENGHIDIYKVMRNEGQRSVIIHILRKIAKDLTKPEPEPIKEEPKYI